MGEKERKGKPELILTILTLLYGVITFITPNLQSIDSNGPKFFTLALLNCITFFVFWRNRSKWNIDLSLDRFFKSKIGALSSVFLLLVLLSFISAINIPEAIVTFSKWMTVFSTVLALSVIIALNRVHLKQLAYVMVALSIVDSITVFYGISQYVAGKIEIIYDIKAGYSNKNILTAAIFLKLPFALWLVSFHKGRLHWLGVVSTFLISISILLLSTRTFYLGLVLILIMFAGFSLYEYFKRGIKEQLGNLLKVVGVVVVSFFLFSFIQQNVYPQAKDGDIFNRGFLERLAHIKADPGGERLESWKRSAKLIAAQPVLGVGAGNWKLEVLQYANQDYHDFTYNMKNHNDFLEVAAEVGVVGGVVYLLIFAVCFFSFLSAFFKSERKDYAILFISGFGIVCYSVDAFFNFPADRPEIILLFSIFMAIAIGLGNSTSKLMTKFWPTEKGKTILPVVFVLSLGVMYVCFNNFKSMQLQRTVFEETIKHKLKTKAHQLIDKFPSIPQISQNGEPVTVVKARYLLNEGDVQGGIALLKEHNHSPYDMRREFFLALTYQKLGELDSAQWYSDQVLKNKPNFYNNIKLQSELPRLRDNKDTLIQMMTAYVDNYKEELDPWVYICNLYEERKEYGKVMSLLDSALVELPGDTGLISYRKTMYRKKHEDYFIKYYDPAIDSYNAGNYQAAIGFFNSFISQVKDHPSAYQFRAVSYLYLNEHQKSIADLTHLIELEEADGMIYNLRGVNYYKTGNTDAACQDFRVSSDLGNKDGAKNLREICGS